MNEDDEEWELQVAIALSMGLEPPLRKRQQRYPADANESQKSSRTTDRQVPNQRVSEDEAGPSYAAIQNPVSHPSSVAVSSVAPSPPAPTAATTAPPSANVNVAQQLQQLQSLLNSIGLQPQATVSGAGQPEIPGQAPRGAGRATVKTGKAGPPPTPKWLSDFTAWKLADAPSQPASCTLPPDKNTASHLLKTTLSYPVEFPVANDTTPPPPPSASPAPLSVTLSPDGSIAMTTVKRVLQNCVSRQRGKVDAMSVLSSVFSNGSGAHSAAASEAERSFLDVWIDAAAHAIFEKLASDQKDDLFFEGGRERRSFLTLLATGHISSPLLSRMIAVSCSTHTTTWKELLRAAFEAFKDFKFTQDLSETSRMLAAIAAMTAEPTLLRLLAGELLEEVVEVNKQLAVKARVNGRRWEKASILGPMLSVSAWVDPRAALDAIRSGEVKGILPLALKDVRGYPGNRGNAEPQLLAAQQHVQKVHDAAHAVLKRLAVSKALSPAGVGKEAALAWLSAACYACAPRTEGGEKAVLHADYIDLGCSDGFSLGVAAVALAFVAPVLDKFEIAPDTLLPRLAATAAAPLRFRLGTLLSQRCLAPPSVPSTAEADAADDEVAAPAGVSSGFVAANSAFGDGTSANFMTECFFLAMRALQVGLLPSVFRRNETIQNMTRAFYSLSDGATGRPPPGGPAAKLRASIEIVEDCMQSALLMERSAVLATRLLGVVLSSVYAALQVDKEPERQQQVAAVPECMVRDPINYAAFVVQSGAPDLFAASQGLDKSMHALAAILRSRCVTSTMTRSTIVDFLRDMLRAANPHGGARRGSFLTPPRMRPGAAALTEAVYQTVSSAGVVPALMVAYDEASVVEGLDVDKYHFDKFSMRHHVDIVLEQLWQDSRCMADLVAMAANTHEHRPVLRDFVKALLNDLSYLMDDSLDRIADIQAINAIKDDPAKWDALPAKERETKMSFRASQISTAGGFMHMATKTLGMLLFLVALPPVSALFMSSSLPTHTAHIALHLLDLMLGERGEDVTACKDVKWQPGRVIVDIVTLLLALSKHDDFPPVLALEQAFQESILRKAHVRICDLESTMSMPGATPDRFGTLLEQCVALRAAATPAESSLRSVVESAMALSFPADPAGDSADAVHAQYRQALQPLATGSFDRTAKGGYMYELAKKADAASSVGSRQRQKRIMRELKELQAADKLPCNSNASIFVRTDEERIDIVRACITGPSGTPYEGGCFFFDVLFPQDYPTDAPLMLLETTGGGRVRFNPNLYADGKVCLSLLGTWHGSEQEKWNPESSTLWQVLVSIQAMVLVEDPYFNEPNVEQMRGQAEGEKASARRNASLILDTVRWAMVDVLRNPRPGFEDAVHAHFRVLRGRIVRQCQTWLEQASVQGDLYQQRLAEAVKELYAQLKDL